MNTPLAFIAISVFSVSLGMVSKIRPLYESYYGQKWRKWKIFSTQNLHSSPYSYHTRAATEIFRVKYFSFSSFLSIETLIKWSYFTDDPLLRPRVKWCTASLHSGMANRQHPPTWLTVKWPYVTFEELPYHPSNKTAVLRNSGTLSHKQSSQSGGK